MISSMRLALLSASASAFASASSASASLAGGGASATDSILASASAWDSGAGCISGGAGRAGRGDGADGVKLNGIAELPFSPSHSAGIGADITLKDGSLVLIEKVAADEATIELGHWFERTWQVARMLTPL